MNQTVQSPQAADSAWLASRRQELQWRASDCCDLFSPRDMERRLYKTAIFLSANACLLVCDQLIALLEIGDKPAVQVVSEVFEQLGLRQEIFWEAYRCRAPIEFAGIEERIGRLDGSILPALERLRILEAKVQALPIEHPAKVTSQVLMPLLAVLARGARESVEIAQGRFTVTISAEQVQELMERFRRQAVAQGYSQADAQRFVNERWGGDDAARMASLVAHQTRQLALDQYSTSCGAMFSAEAEIASLQLALDRTEAFLAA